MQNTTGWNRADRNEWHPAARGPQRTTVIAAAAAVLGVVLVIIVAVAR